VGFLFAENPLHTSQFAALLIEFDLLLTYAFSFETQLCLNAFDMHLFWPLGV